MPTYMHLHKQNVVKRMFSCKTLHILYMYTHVTGQRESMLDREGTYIPE